MGGLRVPHVRQSFNWDCGFACAEMALRALGVPASECTLGHLRKIVPSSSIWTVDLAYALRAFGVRCRFLTTTKGVDPSHREKAFYQPTLDRDTTRVNSLFERAHEANVNIEYRSLSPSELRALCGGAHTRGSNLVIGLVDRRRLYRPPQTWGEAESAEPGMEHGADRDLGAGLTVVGHSGPLRCLWIGTGLNAYVAAVLSALQTLVSSVLSDCLSAGGYVGHYVLITSYDTRLRGYYILDPAGDEDLAFIPDAAMSAARLSHGTDEDLLIIPWDQPTLPIGGRMGATHVV